jgi:hypothetical protein
MLVIGTIVIGMKKVSVHPAWLLVVECSEKLQFDGSFAVIFPKWPAREEGIPEGRIPRPSEPEPPLWLLASTSRHNYVRRIGPSLFPDGPGIPRCSLKHVPPIAPHDQHFVLYLHYYCHHDFYTACTIHTSAHRPH